MEKYGVKKYKAALFDLDGVIVDTAKYHYLAWKKLADKLNFEFNETHNERLKGVSRMQSLDILLEIGGLNFTQEEKCIMAQEKNDWYVKYISQMDESEILPGAKECLEELRNKGIKIALGSASKNTLLILKNLKMIEYFDVVIDGNQVAQSKPDPEVFILGAKKLNMLPTECVVFEDAESGVQAAKSAGMYTVGIGKKEILKQADMIISGLDKFEIEILF